MTVFIFSYSKQRTDGSGELKVKGYSEGRVLDIAADSIDDVRDGEMGANDNQLTGAEQEGFGCRQCRQCRQ